MGVTIHFEGKLKSHDALKQTIMHAIAEANKHGWRWQRISEQRVKLKRVRNEQDWDYEGPTEGIGIYPHEDCEPLRLEFDNELYIQEYCKTQFAGPDVHVRIVELLRGLTEFFLFLDVFDEGEFWETNSLEQLAKHLSNTYSALQDELKKYPNAAVKVKLPSGRIVDMMT